MRTERSVWIRGVGVVSALGRDWPATARALAEGRCGIAPIDRFDATGMPCRVASVVDDAWLDPSDRRGEACRDAGDRRGEASSKGLVVGGGGGASASRDGGDRRGEASSKGLVVGG